MGEVVDKVSERWLGSIDKEEPEIVDDFLYKMKDAISAIHATEGYPKGKILKPDEDWLTKIVKNNKKMQEMIPKYDKEERKAIADSWARSHKLYKNFTQWTKQWSSWIDVIGTDEFIWVCKHDLMREKL